MPKNIESLCQVCFIFLPSRPKTPLVSQNYPNQKGFKRFNINGFRPSTNTQWKPLVNLRGRSLNWFGRFSVSFPSRVFVLSTFGVVLQDLNVIGARECLRYEHLACNNSDDQVHSNTKNYETFISYSNGSSDALLLLFHYLFYFFCALSKIALCNYFCKLTVNFAYVNREYQIFGSTESVKHSNLRCFQLLFISSLRSSRVCLQRVLGFLFDFSRRLSVQLS